MARVVLHAGLHKTGTTALQSFLHGARDELRGRGLIYPQAGAFDWLGGGQHNIAWELAGDRRFEARFGTVDDVAREIADSGMDAILSAEDFESVLHTPERLAPLREHPALRDREFVLLFFVRDQVAYLESLYSEMLRHGVGATLEEFAAPLFGTGRIAFHEWVFQFQYAAMHARLAAWGRMQVIARNYRGSVVGDFIDCVCPGVGMSEQAERANPRDPLGESLAHFFANRMGREASAEERATIERVAAAIGTRPVALSNAFRARLHGRFAASNQQLCRVAGIGAIEAEPAAADAVALEALFDQRTVDAIVAGVSREDVGAGAKPRHDE